LIKKVGDTLSVGDVVDLHNGYKEKITKRHAGSQTSLLRCLRLEEYNKFVILRNEQAKFLSEAFGPDGYDCVSKCLDEIECALAVDYDYQLSRRADLEKAVEALRTLVYGIYS